MNCAFKYLGVEIIEDRTAWRRELASAVCEDLFDRMKVNASVAQTYCPDCGWFLIEVEGQRIAFCWGCTTDRRCAQTGKNLLARAKMAAHGMYVHGNHTEDENPL